MLQLIVCLAFQAWASETGLTPVEQVVVMLKELQTQVQTEGQQESVTYDKYACFCKDKTDEKSNSITRGEGGLSTLQATLASLTSKRTRLTGSIDTCQGNIRFYDEELTNATAMRKNERLAYDAAFADMTHAVAALESAIDTLKASKTMDLVSVKKSVRKSLLIAAALGVSSTDSVKAAAFLEGPYEDAQNFNAPVSDYDFHSGDVISTLEGLLTTFRTKKTDLKGDEVSAKGAFNLAAQAKKDQITTEEATLKRKEKELTTTNANIAQTNQDLSEVNAVLNDDRLYLKDLSSQCETKAKQWDQRSAMRADELAAITQALSVIEGAVATKAGETGDGQRSLVATQDPKTGKALWHAETEVPFAFVQVSPHKPQMVEKKKVDARVAKVVGLLKKEGFSLKSKILSTLATKLGSDPFAKVKTLIQELIERLLQSAADEATQKGWCDTETAKSVKDRDYRKRDLDELQQSLLSLYARQGELEENKDTLIDDINTLAFDLSNATQVRNEEKAENEEAVANARQGATAVAQAIDILSHFYGEAKQAIVNTSLIQQYPHNVSVPDSSVSSSEVTGAPDAGFDSAYTGSQSESEGVTGMLEVIRGDFQRTVRDTTLAEEQAVRDFVEYERQNKVSSATKLAALAQMKSELSDTTATISTKLGDFQSKSTLLDGAIASLEGLQPMCETPGQSTPEERKQKREDEIDALKQALCILDDGEGDACNTVFLQKRARRSS